MHNCNVVSRKYSRIMLIKKPLKPNPNLASMNTIGHNVFTQQVRKKLQHDETNG